MYNNEMHPQWKNNSKGGHSKLEIESLVPEYIEHWLYHILYFSGYNRIQCRTYCKLMTH